MAKRRRTSGQRFPLLIYDRMWQRWALPCFLLVPASVVLWRIAPRLLITGTVLRTLALIPGAAALVILAYAYLARRLAWVQCRLNHLYIQTPFYPLAISYSRIKGARPNRFSQVFEPTQLKASHRSWLQPYWGRTAIVLELAKYPMRRDWLRLWFSPYLFAPNATGFVLLVEDWMTFSRELDQFHGAWEMRRAARRQREAAGRPY